MLFLTDLNSENYRLQVELIHNDFLDQFSYFEFYVFKGNPPIFNLLIGFRYTFLILSFITAIVFMVHLYKIKASNRTIEHNLLGMLGVSLFFFNDPLFGSVLINPKKINIVISCLFVVQFIAFSFYFYAVIAIRMHKKEFRPISSINTFKLKAFFILYFVVLAVPVCIYQSNVDLHPSYYNDKSYGLTFEIFAVLAMIITVFIIVVTILIICRSFSQNSLVPLRYINMS